MRTYRTHAYESIHNTRARGVHFQHFDQLRNYVGCDSLHHIYLLVARRAVTITHTESVRLNSYRVVKIFANKRNKRKMNEAMKIITYSRYAECMKSGRAATGLYRIRLDAITK